jgi:hypothetical protein
MTCRNKTSIALAAPKIFLIGGEGSERYEYIPASLLVIEDVCLKYACD